MPDDSHQDAPPSVPENTDEPRKPVPLGLGLFSTPPTRDPLADLTDPRWRDDAGTLRAGAIFSESIPDVLPNEITEEEETSEVDPDDPTDAVPIVNPTADTPTPDDDRRAKDAARAMAQQLVRDAQQRIQHDHVEALAHELVQSAPATHSANPPTQTSSSNLAGRAMRPVSALEALKREQSKPPPLTETHTTQGEVLACIVKQYLPQATVTGPTRVVDTASFCDHWDAIARNAQQDEQLGLQVLAPMLTDAANRIPHGLFMTSIIATHGRPWAIWVDCERNVILALLPDPDRWLC